MPYKLQVAVQWKTLGILRIELLHFQVHMNCESFQDLIATLAFEQLSKETQALVNSIMSTLVGAMNTKWVTTEENVQEIDMGAEVAASKVVEVLVEVHKSPRMSRSKPTPTKETTKDKKGKYPTLPVHTLPRQTHQSPFPRRKARP